MYTIIDDNGFALWVQKDEPTENFTQIPIPTGMKKPQVINDIWVETFVEEVPQSVTNMNLKLALIQSGISISQIESLITDEATKVLWNNAVIFERNNTTLTAMATA